MKLNENIKNFRTFRGIKQQQLADALGKSKSVISNWERGENSPDVESCEKICRILKVTPNELFGWEENKEYAEHLKIIQAYYDRIHDLKSEIDSITNKLISMKTIEVDEYLSESSDDEDDSTSK